VNLYGVKDIEVCIETGRWRMLSFLLFKDWIVLCFSPWYKNEQGVETRRALGLMGALAVVSQYAAQYMSGRCGVMSFTEKLWVASL
jgi:hypothetical protein